MSAGDSSTSEPVAERPDFGEGYTSEASTAFAPPAWSTVARRLAESRNYWVCTTRADGGPHAAPVWGVWHEDALVFATSKHSVKGANLGRDGRVAVHLESGDDVVIVTGLAIALVAPDGVAPQVLDDYEGKYDFRPEVGTSDNDVWFCVRPATVVCWNEADFVASQVRYRFPPASPDKTAQA